MNSVNNPIFNILKKEKDNNDERWLEPSTFSGMDYNPSL